ncbi:UvrB/UvrC motif-containing protein [Papillibacter cinnamivorans]|uniref:Protein-arginine kinase activator protein McsA n=1 Tax=Papillibacter cinnamivorans DSM 12816 TaxID=1122930 RepID=A0A1W1ZZB2_9FIRM|nr:UvrB/UvrC motif-containing protein [Papillibacter cinnamivorans]SMC53723.1 Protein-arginine kinase activator protein McsA [Papillibacter cinnamivorans DSM 12816]
MLCQNCGKHEAVFHYTRNINGTISEQHLCEDCAAHFNAASWTGREEDPTLSAILSQFTGGWLVIPAIIASRNVEGAAGEIPEAKRPGDPDRAEKQVGTADHTIPEAVAEKLKARRELQLLHRQLQDASDAQDYELAAELRDKIRQLENKGGSTPAEK